jgi:hypothetical protein
MRKIKREELLQTEQKPGKNLKQREQSKEGELREKKQSSKTKMKI